MGRLPEIGPAMVQQVRARGCRRASDRHVGRNRLFFWTAPQVYSLTVPAQCL